MNRIKKERPESPSKRAHQNRYKRAEFPHRKPKLAWRLQPITREWPAIRENQILFCLLEYPHSVGQTAPILVSVRRISDTDRSRWPDVSKWAMVGVFLRSCAEKQDSGRARVA